MEVLLSFGAALLALRLAGRLLRRGFRVWAAAFAAYSLASASLAWGAAAGWGEAAFRVYYLCGGLLTAPLLGAGSLLLVGRRRAATVALAWSAFAAGLVLAVPVHGAFAGTAIPAAQAHLSFFPARLAAVVANSLGTLAAVGVAVATFRHRPVGNALVLAGIACAAAGSAVAGLGVASTAAAIALGVLLLYAGVVTPATTRLRAPHRVASALARRG